MNLFTVLIYASLQIVALFATKYVLSVLDFRYPMVFQGWQTLVGFFVLQILSALPRSKPIVTLAALDKSGLVSLLPSFVLYTLSIIAGSRALASIPVIVFISVTNMLPAVVQLLDTTALTSTTTSSQANVGRKKVAAIIVVATAISLCVFSPEDLTYPTAPGIGSLVTLSPYLALIVHVMCGFALTLHSRIADARYCMVDKQLYSYGFSLIVLAPASLYLEEAFDALHFQHRRQIRFVLGSVVCAVAGALISLFQARLKERNSFGLLHHAGLGLTAIVSVAIFPTELPWWAWFLASINLGATLLIPTHIKPDENALNNADSITKTVAGNISYKNIPTIEV